jgi:hypothetical protein
MALSDTYLRFTLENTITEREEKLISLVVNEVAWSDFPLLEEDEDIFEGLVYETEQGHSIEFPLSKDLDENKVEQICDILGEYIEDFTVEASGDK